VQTSAQASLRATTASGADISAMTARMAWARRIDERLAYWPRGWKAPPAKHPPSSFSAKVEYGKLWFSGARRNYPYSKTVALGSAFEGRFLADRLVLVLSWNHGDLPPAFGFPH